jgi:predicted SnoaL-like aldol condensation-catalyzing enzyme
MGDTVRNKELVREFWTARPEDQRGYLTDDACWHLPTSIGRRRPGGADLHGDGARAIFTDATEVYEPGGTSEILHVIAEGDLVSLHCRLQARTTNGADYHGAYHMLFRVEGERIAEVWEFLDTAYLMECLTEPRAG